MEQIGDSEYYEVTSKKRRYKEDTALAQGAFILCQSKLVLLSFYYKFLRKFVGEFSILTCCCLLVHLLLTSAKEDLVLISCDTGFCFDLAT